MKNSIIKIKEDSIFILFFFGSLLCSGQKPIQNHVTSIYNNINYIDDSSRILGQNSFGTEVEEEFSEEAQGTDRIWGIRLSPHGNFKIAANAIVNYAKNYHFQQSNYNPNWICLGPNGTPLPAQSNSYLGIGQITRLTFDPNYNGTSNKIIYAASTYGGLWRSENTGDNWTLVNTNSLPLTNIADIAIDASDHNHLFVTIGLCDGAYPTGWGPNWSYVNPLFTGGIWRSLDYGQSWESITNNFYLDFTDGGTPRRMINDPNNPSNLYIATTWGIYRTQNAIDPNKSNVTWTRVYPYSGNPTEEFRGLEFKPGNPNTIYAGGKDIYKSTDGGSTWTSMTGPSTGLDITTLPNDFSVESINIAVSQNDPDRVYAYLEGTTNLSGSNGCVRHRVYIYLFVNNHWDEIHEQISSSYNCAGLSAAWLGFAAYHNPQQNLDELFYGGVSLYGTLNLSNFTNFSGDGFHADVHCLAYEPNITNPKLFCGDDGGISVLTINTANPYNSTFQFKNDGLENSLIWAFDDSESNKDQIITAHQDNCIIQTYRVSTELKWYSIMSSMDGYSARIDDVNPDLEFIEMNYPYFYRINNDPNNPTNNTYHHETALLPLDCYHEYLNQTWLPETFPMVNDPQTGEMYFGFSELFKRKHDDPPSGGNWDDLWVQESDLCKTVAWYGDRRITEIAIAESNPDYIYLVTAGQTFQGTPPDDQMHSKLYMTTQGNIEVNCNLPNFCNLPDKKFNRLDFGDTFTGTNIPIITGITVDPLHEERFWVCFSGYIPQYKVWRYDPTDPGNHWTNADPNGELVNLPVNGIVYQTGTNDRLYIGTDAGVYVKNGNSWEKYGDFPNVRVVELKINNCINKLRVATYGRGVWEGDLLPRETFPENIISGDETWDFNRNLKGNLRIQSGALLTVTNTCTVNMPPDSKVIIEPGARLIINGGKFTNSCGQLWEGIEVWGNETKPQNTYYQGVIDISNGGQIENAKIGILVGKRTCQNCTTYDDTKTGGIIWTNGGFFKNNNIGVYIRPFMTYNYTCRFTLCQFSTTPDIIDIRQFDSFIKISNINQIQVQGCTFDNSYSSDPYGYGIYADGSGIHVDGACTAQIQPCPEPNFIHTSFSNLMRGIYCINNGPYYRIIFVANSDFIGIPRGLYLNGYDYPTLILNTFSIPNRTGGIQDAIPPYGMYLDFCTLYQVEGNEFFSVETTPNSVGLIINWSGTGPNEIYRNDFHDLQYSTIAQDINKNPSHGDIGLCYVCNKFKATDVEIAITRSLPLNQSVGIAENQHGVFNGNSIPPFNQFYLYVPAQYDIFNDCYDIWYLVPQNPYPPFSNGYWFYPLIYSPNVHLITTSTIYSEEQCSSKINNGNPGNGDEFMSNPDKLELILKNRNTLRSNYELAFMHLEKEKYSDAEKIMTEIPLLFNLSAIQEEEYQSFVSLFTITKDILFHSSSLLNISVEQSAKLRELARKNNLPGTYAKNLLIACKKLDYLEPVILPVFEENNLETIIISEHLKVHPNPANDYFILEYKLNNNELKNALINIYNMTGLKIDSERLKENTNEIIIHTKDWPVGIYLISLEFGNNTKESVKIAISR